MRVIGFLKKQVRKVDYSDDVTAKKSPEKGSAASGGHSEDELFRDAAEIIVNAWEELKINMN